MGFGPPVHHMILAYASPLVRPTEVCRPGLRLFC